jgi:hypothetical protein
MESRWRARRSSSGAGGRDLVNYFGINLLPEVAGNSINDFVQGGLRAEAGEGLEFFDGGDAAHHVLEAGLVSFVVGDIFDGRRAAGSCFHAVSQTLDGNFLGTADIDDFTDGTVRVHQADEGFDGVPDVAETTRLLAIPVDLDGGMVESGLHEIREYHAVPAGLARTDGIKQTGHDHRKLFLLPVGEREKLIEGFRSGVAPASLGSGAKDQIRVFVEGDIGVLAVDLGGGSGENEFAFLAGGFQDHLCAVDVGLDGLDRAFDDELDANRGGEVHNDIGVVYELGEQLAIFDSVEVILEVIAGFQMTNIIDAAGREIVEKDDALAAIEKPLGKMGSDKTSTAGD